MNSNLDAETKRVGDSRFPLQAITANGRTIAFRESGPSDGQPIVLVHGWPQTSWAWRHQLEHLATLGYRVVAPDLRGVGGSTVFDTYEDYALRKHVDDLITLVDALGIDRATWVGHDWGAPVIWTTARHHPQRFAAGGSISTPYDTLELGFDRMASFARRDVYPEDSYPAAQMDYYLFYKENFAAAQAHFEADIAAFFSAIFRGDEADQEKAISPTGTVRRRGGWFDGGSAPQLPLDATVVTAEDQERYVDDYTRTGFFGTNAFYMNDEDNRDFVASAKRERIDFPALLITGRRDYVNDAVYSGLADPMRRHCTDLHTLKLDGSHWLHQEKPIEVSRAIGQLASRGAAAG